MILEKGNMWDVFGETDLFLITTNPIVRKDGAAVMGRGIAKEAATRYPEIQRSFGQLLENTNADRQGCNWICRVDWQDIGYFMVKDHWASHADLDIISRSTVSLIELLKDEELDRVDLNFPGTGNGKLKREDVLPIIEQLPDNVHVWEYK